MASPLGTSMDRKPSKTLSMSEAFEEPEEWERKLSEPLPPATSLDDNGVKPPLPTKNETARDRKAAEKRAKLAERSEKRTAAAEAKKKALAEKREKKKAAAEDKKAEKQVKLAEKKARRDEKKFKSPTATKPAPDFVEGWTDEEKAQRELMLTRSGEVEFMLRNKLKRNEDIERTLAKVRDGLGFMAELEAKAAELEILKGELIGYILPFGSNHGVRSQSSQTRHVIKNLPGHIRRRMTDQEVASLVKGANSVRRLVRFKVADDNDLNQCKTGLQLAVEFFEYVEKEAEKTGRATMKVVIDLRP